MAKLIRSLSYNKLKQKIIHLLGNLNISTRLNLGFGVLVGLTLLVIIISFMAGQTATENINRVGDLHVPASLESAKAQTSLLKTMTDVRGYLVLDEPQYIESYNKNRAAFEANLAKLEQLSSTWTNPDNIQRLDQLQTTFSEWVVLPDQLFTLHDNPRESQPTLRIARLEVQPLNDIIIDQTDKLIKIQEQQDISAENIGLLKDMVNFRASFKTMITGLRAYATTRDLASKFTYTANLAENEETWDNLLAKKSQLSNEQQILLDEIEQARQQLLLLPIQIFEIGEGERAHEDLYLFKTQVVPKAEEMLRLLDELATNQQNLLQTDLNKGRQGLTNTQWQTILGGMLALVLGLLMAILFRKSIANPIERLTDTAEQIAGGNLTARASVESGDEIGRLATTFNTMTNQLSQTIHDLEDAHNKLEQRVEARTQELSEANALLQEQIAERERAEEKLAQERNLLRTLIDNISAQIFIKDTKSRFIVANMATAQFMDTTPQELIGKTDFDYYPQDEAALYYTQEQTILESGYPIINKDEQRNSFSGDVIWTSTTKTPLKDSKSNNTGLIGIVQDITARKQSEQEREQLITELEAKNTELERFTYTVSHDLKSPLVTIRGFVGLLEQDIKTNSIDRIETDIHYIRDAAEKMKTLLDDLLELSRIGRLINPTEKVSLAKLAHEAVNMVAGQIKARQVHVDISPDLPYVIGDPPRLLEVFQNLIDNAVKFMGDQPNPQIVVGIRQTPINAVYYVQDNGIGIASRYHEKIFNLFDRLNQDIEGTGIGLALVKRIIEVHGGKIWVESKGEGYGSRFCFTIPTKPE